jgi:hypothetical protein
MNLFSKTILRITRQSAQETSHVGTNAVLRIVFDLILAYENSWDAAAVKSACLGLPHHPGRGSHGGRHSLAIASLGSIELGKIIEAGGSGGVLRPQLLHTPNPASRPASPAALGQPRADGTKQLKGLA